MVFAITPSADKIQAIAGIVLIQMQRKHSILRKGGTGAAHTALSVHPGIGRKVGHGIPVANIGHVDLRPGSQGSSRGNFIALQHACSGDLVGFNPLGIGQSLTLSIGRIHRNVGILGTGVLGVLRIVNPERHRDGLGLQRGCVIRGNGFRHNRRLFGGRGNRDGIGKVLRTILGGHIRFEGGGTRCQCGDNQLAVFCTSLHHIL